MGKPADLLWKSEPRTLLKHQIYRKYLYCWMGKICQRFTAASIVDAFAGPGVYVDGPDGSSVVTAKAFLEHARLERFNYLSLFCVEKRPDRREHLVSVMAEQRRSPKLKIEIMPAGGIEEHFVDLDRRVHGAGPRTPTLWILDPFDISSVPFDLVKACLARPYDEVLITWFSDELYRFCEHEPKHAAIDRHFGHSEWRKALEVTGEAPRKEALLGAYRLGLESLDHIKTEAISISSKNAHARYSIVFATHSDKGLQCFNQAKWSIDPHRGKSVNEKAVSQDSLFDFEPDLGPLRQKLAALAGHAHTFESLAAATIRNGFKETHLRTVLSEMAADGTAIREHPLDAKSPWPPGSLIRFYAPDVDSEVPLSSPASAP